MLLLQALGHCISSHYCRINMNATALECNFTSFATTEPQFTQSVDTIMAALTNDSLPSVDILVETVSVAGVLVSSW